MANADLTKISVFIFFDKTYLQKPHCIMIEYISSNKTQLQLRFVFKNKDLKRLFITSPSLHWFPQVVVWTLAITHTSCKDLKVESDFSTIFSLSENCHPDKHKHTHTHTHTHTCPFIHKKIWRTFIKNIKHKIKYFSPRRQTCY